jgi:NADH dehydrogenase
MSGTIATIFGGSGFIGRHIASQLAAAGHTVRIAVRHPDALRLTLPPGTPGSLVPTVASITDPTAIARAVAGAELVVLSVGILAEQRAGDFARLQAEAPGHVAAACAAAGVRRLVNISAIGADLTSPSAYGRSKAQGEANLLLHMPRATILRPSIVFGPEDQFFNRFAAMARFSPVLPVICGSSRFQPVYVGDVAAAVRAAVVRPDAEVAGRIYELGGPAIFTFKQLMQLVLQYTHRQRWLLDVPLPLATLQARVLERLPGQLLTTDQLLMLQRDNVVHEHTPGLTELGITPTPVEEIVPGYLARYR